jgi:hypothetical protein
MEEVCSMSSDHDPLQRWMTEALKRAAASNGSSGAAKPRELDDIERMVELIEAASGKIASLDLDQVEAAFAGQAAALDVIFGQFARAAGRKYWVFDSMRVALRAQAQCRATYTGLIALKRPRPALADRALASQVENSREQTIESEKGPA